MKSIERLSPLAPDLEKSERSAENIARERLFSLHLTTILILYLLSTLYTGASNGPKVIRGRSLYSPFASVSKFFESMPDAFISSFSSFDERVISAMSQNGGKRSCLRRRISFS